MQSFLNQIKKWLAPDYKDESEKLFCKRWMFERAYSLVKTGYIIAIPMNIVALALFPFFTSESVRWYFNMVHGGYLALLLSAGIFYKRPKIFVPVLCLMTIGFVLSYNYGMHLVWALKEAGQAEVSHRALRVALGVAAMGIFSLQLLPLTPILGVICTAVYAVGAYGALIYFAKDGIIIATIMTFLFAFALLMRQRTHFTSIREAQAEYQTRAKIAPSHILRKSLERSVDIDQVFAPKKKFCACISSDWRSYQQLSVSLTSSQLADALSIYYDECDRLLRLAFPSGNYFSDWIADELFVVAYASKSMNEEQLADAALTFAKQLIVFKQGFYDEYQFPAAIDVGVSVGDALLGMMGPKSYRKATALGRVPGEARRLQSIGKELRERIKPTDRVVFNKAVYTQLQRSDSPIHSIQSAEVTNVRDLDDNVFYYVEPVIDHYSNPKQEAA